MFEIFCLMMVNVRMTGAMSRMLLHEAQQMALKEQKRRSFEHDTFAGVVSTEFKGVNLGSLYGTQFEAEVESDLGKGKVRFFVEPNLLPTIDIDKHVVGPYQGWLDGANAESSSLN